jgi:hypothetical protein
MNVVNVVRVVNKAGKRRNSDGGQAARRVGGSTATGAAGAIAGIQLMTGSGAGIQLPFSAADSAAGSMTGSLATMLGIQLAGTTPGIQLSGAMVADPGIQLSGPEGTSVPPGAGSAGTPPCAVVNAVPPAEDRARSNRAAAVVLVVVRRNRDIVILDKGGRGVWW